MSRYPGKKLPPRWVYVPSLAQVRRLCREPATDVQVGLGGTGSGLRPSGSLSLGWHERRVVEGRWRFYLHLWGVPESILGDRHEAVGREVIRAIRQSVAGCPASPATGVTVATQMLLYVRVAPEGMSIDTKIEPVHRHSFSAGSWWTSGGPA